MFAPKVAGVETSMFHAILYGLWVIVIPFSKEFHGKTTTVSTSSSSFVGCVDVFI
jgi:hypothetical protein